MNSYISSEIFTLFDYQVGHQGLMLRANSKSDRSFSNLDLIFDGVTFVSIPTVILGVDIIVDRSSEYSSLLGTSANMEEKVYLIHSQGKKYFIVANSFIAIENNLSWEVSSLGFGDFEFRKLYHA
jgi:hypothetical protein